MPSGLRYRRKGSVLLYSGYQDDSFQPGGKISVPYWKIVKKLIKKTPPLALKLLGQRDHHGCD